jgi:hypothetical protein
MKKSGANSFAKRILGIIFLFFVLVPYANAQYSEDTITTSGTGDLTIPMGRYHIGNAIRIETQISGAWAQDGGVYHIVGDWNHRPKVLYRGESSISSRLTFYGYVDPNSPSNAFLYATWNNTSPSESKSNTVYFRITSAGNFDVANTGDFSNAQELSNILVVQSYTENVGIGTTDPTAKLTVNGTTKTKEVIVSEDVGADFVFNDDYSLPSLAEIEKYIKSNNHLPEIPSAKEMKKKGVKIGDLQIKLLQKIEELTLQMIQQNKETQQQQVLIGRQQKLLQRQQQKIKRLETRLNESMQHK